MEKATGNERKTGPPRFSRHCEHTKRPLEKLEMQKDHSHYSCPNLIFPSR